MSENTAALDFIADAHRRLLAIPRSSRCYENYSTARAGNLDAGVLQHLQITAGIAKRHDRAAANVLNDADGFAILVVDEVNRGPLHPNFNSPQLLPVEMLGCERLYAVERKKQLNGQWLLAPKRASL